MQAQARVPLEEFTSADLSILRGGNKHEDSIQVNVKPIQNPPELLLQFNKASSYFFNSTLAAFLRGVTSPPPINEANASNVPQWFKQQYLLTEQKVNFTKRFIKDAAGFFVGCYLIDAVKETAKTARGVDDVWNSVFGGTAAGILIGQLWHPNNVQGRSMLLLGGAIYGYVSCEMQDYSKRYLLEQQKLLEKQVLHKSGDEVQPALNISYLQELMRLRQKEFLAQKEAAAAGKVVGVQPQSPTSLRDGGAAPAAAGVNDWSAATSTVSGGNPWLVINDDGNSSRDRQL